MERTLAIIKPDAVAAGHIGAILQSIDDLGFCLVGLRMVQLSKVEAEGFYAVHKERPFFDSLTTFMSSGPVVVSVLEGENAVVFHREIMGATNPAEAAEGTIRKDFAQSIGENTVHGSDSLENAAIEIAYFFAQTELVNSQA